MKKILKKYIIAVAASTLGAIKIMLFGSKQAIINRAEGEHSYIITTYKHAEQLQERARNNFSRSHRIRWERIPYCDPRQVCIPTQELGNKMG